MNEGRQISHVSVEQYVIWSDVINEDQNAIPVNWSDNWQDEFAMFLEAELENQEQTSRKVNALTPSEAEWREFLAECDMLEPRELHARRQYLSETVWQRKLKIAKFYGFRPVADKQKEWISADGVVLKDHQLVGHINWLRSIEKADTTRKERKRRKHNGKSAWRKFSNELTEHWKYLQELLYEDSLMAAMDFHSSHYEYDDEPPLLCRHILLHNTGSQS